MRAVRVSLLVVPLLALVLMAPVSGLRAQQAAEPEATVAAQPSVPPEITDVVKQQFGTCFQIATERSAVAVKYLHPPAEPPWVTYFTADLNDDGVEDLVVVARCGNPLANQADFDYTVVDPYFASNGYGDPRITAQFSSGDPGRNNLVLVIFGAGPQAWRGEKAKSKWVLINLPFDRIASSHVEAGKKKKLHKVAAVGLEENDDGGTSVVFWNGRRWVWADLTGH